MLAFAAFVGGRPGAMLLIVGRTLSAIAARARLLQGNGVSAAFVGGPPRREALVFCADCVRYRRGSRDPHGCGKYCKPDGSGRGPAWWGGLGSVGACWPPAVFDAWLLSVLLDLLNTLLLSGVGRLVHTRPGQQARDDKARHSRTPRTL